MSINLKNMLTQRLGLKLASIFLSLVVFVHVYTEQEREWTFEVPLEIANLADNLCLVSPPPATVLVSVRGKGKDLIKLRLKGARAVVDLAEAGPGTVKRILSAADIELPPDLSVTVADVFDPKVLSLDVDPKLTKFVRVVPVYSGSLGSGLELSGPPLVEPEQIHVSGARRVLSQLDYINTAPIDISGMTDRSVVDARLDPGAHNLALEPSSVRVTFLVERVPTGPAGPESAGGPSQGGG
jgi:YbbR domain-containing protein